MSPLELVDDRFDKLAEELRASRPVAPVALRAQVRTLEPPGLRWTFRWPSRRMVFALAAAAVLGSLFVAGITGLSRSGSQRSVAGERFRSTLTPRQAPSVEKGSAVAPKALKTPAPNFGTVTRSADLAPAAGRLQRYQATLRLRVKDVDAMSSAAKRAMNLAHGLGGYVASVQYASRSKGGGATLVLRVPVGNVQTALAELASLGTILQQHTGILDVTRRVDREALQIAQLERAARPRFAVGGAGHPRQARDPAGQACTAAEERPPRADHARPDDSREAGGRSTEPLRPHARRRGLGARPRA